MWKKIVVGFLCCVIIFVQLLIAPCKAEDEFDAILEKGLTLNSLPDNVPTIVQIYQCQVLASVLQPGMPIEDVKAYIEKMCLQPAKVTQIGSEDEMITTFFFPPYFRLRMDGEVVKRIVLEIAPDTEAETYVSIPLSIQYTAHTLVNEKASESRYMPSVSKVSEEINEHIRQEIIKLNIAHFSFEGNSMVSVFTQFAIFTSVLYPGIPKESLLSYAQEIPALTACTRTEEENEITWMWSERVEGGITFYCELEDGKLAHTGFEVDHISLGNALLLEDMYTFHVDESIQNGIAGYVYSPITYIELMDTWVCQEP